MNQILGNTQNKIDFSNNKSNIKKLKFIFWFSIITIFICIIIYSFVKYNTSKKEKFAKRLANQFSITTLYNNNNITNNYISKRTYTNLASYEPFVIGLIKIDKINLFYPILSNSSDELLKIAPCKFYGPMPNKIGNLCIAGHNNADKTMFGKIYLLEKNDIIQIYDLNGSEKKYTIYKKQEVKSTDTSCLNQNTNNISEITLITCNNIKGNRIIIKAKENR